MRPTRGDDHVVPCCRVHPDAHSEPAHGAACGRCAARGQGATHRRDHAGGPSRSLEGQTIALEVRWGEGQHERYPALAADLVQLPVDLIVAAGASPARAAKHATTTIPIVMLVGIDAVAQGLVASLAHPGGNITGLTMMSHELSGKRLELLQEAVPGLSHVALLVDAGNPNRQAHLHAHEAAARVLGIQLLPLEVRGPDDFVGAFQAATQGQAQALIMPESALFFTQRARLAELALASRLPTTSGATGYAEAGGLMHYGPDLPGSFRRVAVYVDKILKGAQPVELPVEQPMKFEPVLPTSPRESRFFMAYSHPYEGNPMPWRQSCRSRPHCTRSTNWTNEPRSLSTGARRGHTPASAFPKRSGIRPSRWPRPCRPRAWPNSYGCA
jgi:ABC-type uncharacterized transport system substrate-binding protein